jgi:hypothetical protein
VALLTNVFSGTHLPVKIPGIAIGRKELPYEEDFLAAEAVR